MKCNNKDCSASTGIDGELTFGWGEFFDGYWEHPCKICEENYLARQNDPNNFTLSYKNGWQCFVALSHLEKHFDLFSYLKNESITNVGNKGYMMFILRNKYEHSVEDTLIHKFGMRHVWRNI